MISNDNLMTQRGHAMLKPANVLLREVARLHALIQRLSVACCDRTTLTQCHIITELGDKGPLSLSGLQKNLSLDKGWLSRAVEVLASEGLIVKRPSPTDGRSILISLSESGLLRLAALNEILNEQSARVLSRIPDVEHEGILHSLELLLDALKQEVNDPDGCCCDSTIRKKGVVNHE